MTTKEIEALTVVVNSLHDCWYRDVLKNLLEKGTTNE